MFRYQAIALAFEREIDPAMQHPSFPRLKDGFAGASNAPDDTAMRSLRKTGHYWVVFLGEWDIASWSGDWWEFAGLPDAAYTDGDLERIGPYIPHPEDEMAPESRLAEHKVGPRLVRHG